MNVTTSRTIKNYKDLRVWQESMELAEEVYAMCGSLPRDETYGLAAQMKRATVSIPSNIAEGHSKRHRAEYRQSIYVAVGSLAELETQLHLAGRLRLLPDQRLAPVFARIDRLKAMLVTLGQKLK